jgi:cytochrome oxidase Cu insertion factor (SCO1/SenC/PrrC family)
MKISPRVKFVLLASLFAAPIVASTLAYRYSHRAPTANHGELLLPPAQAAATTLPRVGGGTFSFQDLRGRWVLVTADTGACPEACRRKLYLLRQVRLAMGRNAERVRRVFVVTDAKAPDATALEPYAGMDVAIPAPGTAGVPALADPGRVYLVDPNGNVMMRWNPADDPKGMIRDLERLLRVSQIG